MEELQYDETVSLTNTELRNFSFLTKEEEVEHTQNLKFYAIFALPRKTLNFAVHRIWENTYAEQTTKILTPMNKQRKRKIVNKQRKGGKKKTQT